MGNFKTSNMGKEIIPTAEEMCKEWGLTNENDGDPQGMGTLILFAQLHVTEALKQASEKAKVKQLLSGSENEYFEVDKDSILSAYPLTNIK